MNSRVICATVALALFWGGLVCCAAAPQTGRLEYRLWGGQAAITLPAAVSVLRGKENSTRHEASLREKPDIRKVVFQRGQIARKYSRVSTARIGAIARDRLEKKGYQIHEFQVPWQARLRWIRQTDHQTCQSTLKMSVAEWESRIYTQLEQSAASLGVPLKKVSLRGRIKDTAAAVPIAGQKVGSWFPGWNF